MSTENQPRQGEAKWVDMLLIVVGVLIAWPALLIGAVARLLIKQRATDPFPYWIGAGVLGSIGAWFLYAHANPYPFLLVVLRDLVPLFFHLSGTTIIRFLLDALPLWVRGLLVFPWCTLLIELFSPKSLEGQLLAQERQRRVVQARHSKRAASKALQAPDQINGKGVFGVLIENPND